jgi:hypothetical protein
MSPWFNFTGRIGAHREKVRRLIAPALCAFCLVLGGGEFSLGSRSAPMHPLTASSAWAGKSVPAVERQVVLRSGFFTTSDLDGGPPVP